MTVRKSASPYVRFLKRWGRVVILLGIAQFGVSTALLLIAATSYWNQPPQWEQTLDVFLAFSIVITAGCIYHAAGTITDHHIWYQSYRIANYLPVIVLLLLWLGQHRFEFNFLTGLAWRLWLVLFILPSSIRLWQVSDTKANR